MGIQCTVHCLYVADESARYACAVTMQAITRRNAEKVKMFGTIALPVAFLGMHEKTSGT